MKHTLSTIRDWFTRNKSAIIDTMITILSTLGMISFTIVATIAVVVVVAGAWIGAGGIMDIFDEFVSALRFVWELDFGPAALIGGLVIGVAASVWFVGGIKGKW